MHEITRVADRDSYVSSHARGAHFGGLAALQVGRSRTGAVYRSFLHFDLAGLPPGALIADAELRLFVRRNPSPHHGKILVVRPILGRWSELGIDWRHQPPVGPITARNTVYERPGEVVALSVTNLVRSWRDGIIKNRGLVVAARDEHRFSFVKFGSRERSRAAARPRLVIWTHAFAEAPSFGHRPQFRSKVRRDVHVNDVPLVVLRRDVRHENLVTYTVHNRGPDAAVVDLQLSPDGTLWFDDPPQRTVRPGQTAALVPRYFQRFARILAHAEDPGGSARLTVWFQSQSAV